MVKVRVGDIVRMLENNEEVGRVEKIDGKSIFFTGPIHGYGKCYKEDLQKLITYEWVDIVQRP